jgi:hypothetical protein
VTSRAGAVLAAALLALAACARGPAPAYEMEAPVTRTWTGETTTTTLEPPRGWEGRRAW